MSSIPNQYKKEAKPILALLKTGEWVQVQWCDKCEVWEFNPEGLEPVIFNCSDEAIKGYVPMEHLPKERALALDPDPDPI